MEHARSPYIITADVDFVPSGGNAPSLRRHSLQLNLAFRRCQSVSVQPPIITVRNGSDVGAVQTATLWPVSGSPPP
jgi:hypothetical protein